MLGQLCSLTPDEPDVDPDKVAETAGGPNRTGMVISGALNYFVQRPIAMAKLLPQTAGVPIEWFRRSRSRTGMPAPFAAPRTVFNGPISPHRSIATTQLSLDDVKRVKNRFGVKVNDVVLAMVGGALREYLSQHGDLPGSPLVAMVPVSVHDADERDLVVNGTNKVTGMFTELRRTSPIRSNGSNVPGNSPAAPRNITPTSTRTSCVRGHSSPPAPRCRR